jgi:hypothetical protein
MSWDDIFEYYLYTPDDTEQQEDFEKPYKVFYHECWRLQGLDWSQTESRWQRQGRDG